MSNRNTMHRRGRPEFFGRIDIERLDDPGLEALRNGFVQAMTELVWHEPGHRG